MLFNLELFIIINLIQPQQWESFSTKLDNTVFSALTAYHLMFFFPPLWPDYIAEKQLICVTTKASQLYVCVLSLYLHEICGVTTIWVEGSWRDLHAHISKNVVHFGGLNGLLLKIEAQLCFFNLCAGIILAISINPTATICVLQAKTQQLEVVEPSAIVGVIQQHREAESTEIDKMRASRSWASGAVHLTDRSGRGNVLLPLKTAMMMNGTLWDQLNILSLCGWTVCSYSVPFSYDSSLQTS